MTEEKKKKDPESSGSDKTSDKSEVERLRDEFSEQFATLKNSYEKTAAEQKDLIETLKKENEDLHRALIRSVTFDPQPAPSKEKTEDELYQERIAELAKKSLEIQKKGR